MEIFIGVYYSETEDESFDESESHQHQGSMSSLSRRKGKVPAALPPQSHTSPPTVGASATLGRMRNKSQEAQSNSPSGVSEQSPRPIAKASWSPMAASLDRKYLKRLLRVAPEKQPVPTPQFRSYRKPSPSPSPTTLTAPALAQSHAPVPATSPSWAESMSPSSKPPPRPPSESKPASPFKPPPSSFSDQNRAPSFDFPPSLHSAGRHSADRTTPRSESSSHAFRKSMSTSKLSSGHPQKSPLALPVDVDKERNNSALPLSQRRSLNRRHSIEISDTKKQSTAKSAPSPPAKPQLAPKPNFSSRTLGRPVESSLNRGSREADMSESGYAKIKPRQSSSSASDYIRSPTRTESVGRRSSVSSSRRSSADGSVKSSGNSGSLSRLPSRPTSISPLSPSKGVFDFNQENVG